MDVVEGEVLPDRMVVGRDGGRRRAVVLRGWVFDRAALEALRARRPAAAVLVKARPAPGAQPRQPPSPAAET